MQTQDTSNLPAVLTYILTLLLKELFGLRENKEFPCIRSEGQDLQSGHVSFTPRLQVWLYRHVPTWTAELEGTTHIYTT